MREDGERDFVSDLIVTGSVGRCRRLDIERREADGDDQRAEQDSCNYWGHPDLHDRVGAGGRWERNGTLCADQKY